MPADRPATRLFVTGTDTGVGKTLVAAALALLYRRRGLAVGVMKPCESGVENPARPGADAALLRWAAGCDDDEQLIAPYRLRAPLAPDAAARRDGVTIDPQHIVACCTELAADKELVIIEGAGGLMVPLRGGYLIADLVRDLDSPLLVVTRPDLGTINHTLLTVFAARSMELPLAGFIVNRLPAQPDDAQADAPHQLASLASADLLAVLPEVAGTPEQQVEQLADALAASPTLPWLLHAIGAGIP